jgi:microcystin-dependent protein
MFAGNFAPAGWALCQGQLMPISENDTLFNLIGTTYGGDGQETFGLPDLASRVPNHMGKGPAVSQTYQIGEKAGVESVTLNANSTPTHTHTPVTTATGQVASGAGAILADGSTTQTGSRIYSTQATDVVMNAGSLSITGGSQPHDNIQPSLCINYIISLFGIFPSQN